MEFAWDEAKRQTNIRKHGIDFVEVEKVFEGKTLTVFDNRFDYGEDRYITVGIFEGRVVSIAHTETEEVIRVISIRKATRNEESIYFKEISK